MAAEQPARAIVALGSNLGDPRANILRALRSLQSLSDSPLICSSLWETVPVDCPPGSPSFSNAVAAFSARSDETPQSLLAKLQSLEKELGRQPKRIHNEPRLIDLDLIAFGEITLQSADLILPHPRAHTRRFVLDPLAEIVPALVLPGFRKTVSELLRQLPDTEAPRRLGPALCGE